MQEITSIEMSSRPDEEPWRTPHTYFVYSVELCVLKHT